MGDRCFASSCNRLDAQLWLVSFADISQDARLFKAQVHAACRDLGGNYAIIYHTAPDVVTRGMPNICAQSSSTDCKNVSITDGRAAAGAQEPPAHARARRCS